jgi:hypothetical protein
VIEGGPLTGLPHPFNNKKCNCIEKDKIMNSKSTFFLNKFIFFIVKERRG